MKVLLISRGVSGATPGDFRYSGVFNDTFQLAKALRGHGIDVEVLTPKVWPSHHKRFEEEFGTILKKYKIKHHFANTFVTYGADWGLFRLKMFISELVTLKKVQPDIIQYMQFGPSLLYPFTGKLPIIYYSCYLFGSYPDSDLDNQAKSSEWGSKFTSPLDLFFNIIYTSLAKILGSLNIDEIVKRGAILVFMHPKGYKLAMQKFKGETKTFYIPKGVDLQEAKKWKRKSSLNKNTKILFMGDILYGKGIFDLIEAFKIARKQIAGLKLLIAGTGPRELLKKLKRSIQNYPIKYLGSFNYHQKWKLYKESTIFCLPSYFDAYPSVILEALACGLPIITTYEIDSPVINGKSGVKFISGDVNSLSKAILMLANDPQKMKQMAVFAHKQSLNYSWMSTVQQFKKLYRRLKT